MVINRMALAATLVLGSATAVLAGSDDGKGRDGLWYSPAFTGQAAAQAAERRKGKVYNSYGRGQSDVQRVPSEAEMLWMKRASSSGRY